jgi:hypothetical protein
MSSLVEEQSPLKASLKDNLTQFSTIINSNQVKKHAFLVKAEGLCHQIIDNLNELEIEEEVSY